MKRFFGYGLLIILLCILLYVISTQVREYHLQDDPMLHTLKQSLREIHPSFEKIKLYRGDKSYTINKDKTFLCLYDKKGEYYPMNMLIYVLLHEQAHTLNTEDVGHTEAFYRKFDELLDRATALGIYNPNIPVIRDYCE
jgi:hypothetical protein